MKLSFEFAPNYQEEIDLHGERVFEAIQRVDKFLDTAFYKGHRYVRVIVGIGNGKLSKGVESYLKTSQYVLSYTHMGDFVPLDNKSNCSFIVELIR
jgi:dsDNA-specific endonuclease/ATPase MutS2